MKKPATGPLANPNGATARVGALVPPLMASSAALVLANLVPLGGALLGYWSVYEIVLLFWAENVVVGLMVLLRMASLMVLRRLWSLVVLMGFFTLHYGIFTFVHGMFVVDFLGPPREGLIGAVAFLLAPEGLRWPLLALLASHVFSLVVNFLGQGEWRQANGIGLMVKPYPRIVVLHLVLIFGGSLAAAMGDPVFAVALLVVVKLALDLRAHWAEHKAAQAVA
ncbi:MULTISPECIES: DUF6498-containing protein [Roseomonadaceae]|uniref:Uncharacterized protein n=1 Tax=Falsiroseomonas oleicola TaxID=2801474 RepID=A0ABS6HAW5_9PROT|nr:DUF6498-containing protein [Roseomonas oleicola]MBU8545851.1 hypothetical protein [Roseomonas oleicola]